MALRRVCRNLRMLGCVLVLLVILNNLKIMPVGDLKSQPIQYRIPKILHQVSKSEMVSDKYLKPIESCLRLNPDWTYVLWRDVDAELLIKQHFPGFYEDFYLKYTDSLQKSDSIRYIILYLFGGVYIDMDVECRQPLFPTLANQSCFIDRESPIQTQILWDLKWSAMNSVMGCRSGHPFMLKMIYKMGLFANEKSPLLSTGPLMLTKSIIEWTSQSFGRAIEDQVTLLDHDVFSPYVDNKKRLIKICKEFISGKPLRRMMFNRGRWIRYACKQVDLGGLKDKFSERTLGVHWFMHLGWRSDKEKSLMQKVNITRRLDKVKLYSGKDKAMLLALINTRLFGNWLRF